MGLPNPWHACGRVVQLPVAGEPGGWRRRRGLQPARPASTSSLTVDETTYDEGDGNTTDDDHPISWCQRYEGGRSWYTGMGHTRPRSRGRLPQAPPRRPRGRGRRGGGCGLRQAGRRQPPAGGGSVRTPAGDVSSGDPIEFKATATDPDGDTLTYEWDFGDGGKANTATAIHAYTDAGRLVRQGDGPDGKGGKTEKLLQVAVQPSNENEEEVGVGGLVPGTMALDDHRLGEPRRVLAGRCPRLHGEPVRHRHLDRRGGRADGPRQEHDATGRLVNGPHALASPVQVNADGGEYKPVVRGRAAGRAGEVDRRRSAARR